MTRFGIADGRSITLHFDSGDTLRGYHLLPPGDDAISAASLEGDAKDRYFEAKLAESDNIVIYLHGNAGTRAIPRRISVQKHLAAYCKANVLTFDYRGFGDSLGTPTESGSVEDVRKILDYVKSLNISRSTKLFLYAESLGTGITVSYLSAYPEDIYPEGVVSGIILLAPFTTMGEAALSHPITAPFRIFPSLKKYM